MNKETIMMEDEENDEEMMMMLLFVSLCSQRKECSLAYKAYYLTAQTNIQQLFMAQERIFKDQFIMSQTAFQFLYQQLLAHYDRIPCRNLLPKARILIGLRYLKKSGSIRDQCMFFGRSESIIHGCVREFVTAVITLKGNEFSVNEWPMKKFRRHQRQSACPFVGVGGR